MEVLFLEGTRGQLFAAYHASQQSGPAKGGFVYLPPFAEEMNRSRRMAALQASRLAEKGMAVLLLDPFGTGDSAGDFRDARWDTWRDDVKTALAWLSERCEGPVGLWGLRLGALLAADVAAQYPGGLARLLFWQPLLSGDNYLTQFLRLRVAAGMNGGAEKETTKDLRAKWADGETVEVAGYDVSAELAAAISNIQLQELISSLGDLPLDWFELSSSEEAALTPASRRVVDALTGEGRRISAQAVSGDAFWSIQEITLAPELVSATEGLVAP